MDKIEELIDEISQINDENKDEKIRAVCNLVREIMTAGKPLIIVGGRFSIMNGNSLEITNEFAKCLVHDKNLLQITVTAVNTVLMASKAMEEINKNKSK